MKQESRRIGLKREKGPEGRRSIIFLGIAFIMATMLGGCGKEEHRWVAASCQSPSICEKCGLTQGEALGHDWEAASCTEAKICRRCGMQQGEALGHDWSKVSCKETPQCIRCGIDGEAHDHEFTFEILRDATCGAQGLKKRTCIRCGEELVFSIPPTGQHVYGEWIVVTESTCFQEGIKERQCKNCDHKIQGKQDYAECIDDNKWVVVEKATKEEPGLKATHCKICGEIVRDELIEYQEKKTATGGKTQQGTGQKTSTEASGVNSELKAFLDSYESFMDQYVAFMKKYQNASYSGDFSSVMAMYQDYMNILNQYDDFERKMNAYDSSSMSKADYEYYMTVLYRIEMKLLEAYN